MSLSLVEAAQSNLFFTRAKKAQTKVLGSISFGNCDGGMGSSDKITKILTKSFLFFFSNSMTHLLDLEFLKL